MKLTFLNHDHGEVVIDQGALSLGSGAGNDVVLDAEGIAEKHARLSREDGSVYLRAVDQADVYVNGRRIRERTRVRNGDVLGLHRVQAKISGEDDGGRVAGGEAEEAVDSPATRVRPAIASWYLRGVSGETFGRLFPVSGRMVVGRGQDCDVVLEADEVSRQHAAIEVSSGAVTVEDLESSNGTFVNGERIQKHVLERGDEIAFDTLRFRLETNPARQGAPASKPESRRKPAPAAANKSGGAGVWIVVVIGIVVIAAVGAWAIGLI